MKYMGRFVFHRIAYYDTIKEKNSIGSNQHSGAQLYVTFQQTSHVYMCVRQPTAVAALLGWYQREIYSEPKAIINSDKNDTSKNQNVNLEI